MRAFNLRDMVKHIVLFQLKAELEDQQKQQITENFRQGILALPADIPFIRKIEVSHNINPAEKYDIALYSEFDSLADVQAYAVHPSHVAVAKALIPHVASRACTDYEI